MKKIIIVLFLSIISRTYAIDIQSESMNSDKSLFQSISDYQTIEPGRVFISNSLELTSNPIIDSKKNIVDAFHNDIGILTGLYRNIELGANLSYKKTTVSNTSRVQEFSGLTGVGAELKFNIYKSFSIAPMFIKTMSNASSVGRINDTYGFKFVGAFFDETRTPVFIQYVKTKSLNAKYDIFDQSNRDQVSFGSLFRISRNMNIGSELLFDSYKGNNSKDILIHGTAHYELLSLRGGFGSGFLNKNKQNESRLFFTIMFDFDFRSEKNEKYLKDR